MSDVEDSVVSVIESEVSEEVYDTARTYLKLANQEIERLQASQAELRQRNTEMHAFIEHLQAELAEKIVRSRALVPVAVRPYLGVEVIEQPQPRQPGTCDVAVRQVVEGSSAWDAGVKVGDIVRKWNGLPVRSRAEFGIMVKNADVSSVVNLQVERRGQHQVLRCVIKGVAEAMPQANPAGLVRPHGQHESVVSSGARHQRRGSGTAATQHGHHSHHMHSTQNTSLQSRTAEEFNQYSYGEY